MSHTSNPIPYTIYPGDEIEFVRRFLLPQTTRAYLAAKLKNGTFRLDFWERKYFSVSSSLRQNLRTGICVPHDEVGSRWIEPVEHIHIAINPRDLPWDMFREMKARYRAAAE